MSATPSSLRRQAIQARHHATRAGLLLLGLLLLAPANADERMKTEIDSGGAPTTHESRSDDGASSSHSLNDTSSSHYSSNSTSGSHSTRTAESEKSDNSATYHQDSQPQASKQAKQSATQKVQKSVSGGDVDSNGTRQATTGGAKPTENWFGCSPQGDKQSTHCNGN